MPKAAVVIGVDKTGDLPVLRAAASGAKQFAKWAQDAGFTVRLLTDENGGSVSRSDIFKAVRSVVQQQTFTQLLIYFSGHGILRGPDYELWLLSDAPDDPNDAVNVSGSIWQARNSGIPHVVFISDACRSQPNTPKLTQVTGGIIFPNEPPGRPRPEVDVFYASLPGDPALEAPADKAAAAYDGVFTKCLLPALQGEVTSVIEAMDGDSGPMQVIPSWRLKPYLSDEVPTAAAAISIKLQQIPEIRVESHPPKYLAVVPASRSRVHLPPPDEAAAQPSGMLRHVARQFNLDQFFGAAREPATPVQQAEETRFRLALQRLLRQRGRRGFETRTGFSVLGARIQDAALAGTGFGIFEEDGAHHIRVDGIGKGSILIRFADGRGTCLAVLPGYVGTVLVEDGLVVNVNYTPSAMTDRHLAYEAEAEEVEKRRAFAAVAARRGYFQVEKERSGEFGGYLRGYKTFDPTLGLYSAYAYAQGDLMDGVNSVYRYMRDEGVPVLFDVALLSGKLTREALEAQPPRIAPFCPLLTQGWAFLAGYEEIVPKPVLDVARHLIPALWTTFTAEGIDLLWNPVERGEL